MTIPPEVVLTLASSTVFVKASRRVNRDLAGMLKPAEMAHEDQLSAATRLQGSDVNEGILINTSKRSLVQRNRILLVLTRKDNG